MRRLLALILVSALSASLLVAGPAASAATSSGDSVSAAAYNKKKCKKAKTKRAKKKYCKKKKPPRAPQTQTGTGTGTGTTTTPTTTTPGTTQPGGAQVVRDDAGFTNALVGSKLHKTSEGSYGYGEYTWNFCAGGSWSYRSYYYAGSTVESNDGGSYQVVEGYRAAADPNYFAGIIQVSTSNGSQYRFGVELRGNGGYMKTNTSSFEEGNFSRTVGGAVC